MIDWNERAEEFGSYAIDQRRVAERLRVMGARKSAKQFERSAEWAEGIADRAALIVRSGRRD